MLHYFVFLSNIKFANKYFESVQVLVISSIVDQLIGQFLKC